MKKLLYKIKAVFKGNWKALFKSIDIVHKKSGKSKFIIFFDMFWCLIKYGAGHNDYKAFAFWDLNSKQRDTYLTRFRNKKIIEMLNDGDKSEYFNNKAIFNDKFKDYIKRDALDIKKVSLKEFESFIQKHPVVFCKPYDGDSGKGIEKLDVKDFKNAVYMYNYIKEKNIMVVEEAIKQHKDMAKVNPNAVNCMRLVTVVNGDNVDVLYAVVKFGTTNDYVDNMGRGGSVSGPVDLECGKIMYDLKDMYGKVFSEHPATKVKFKGYKIPKFKEAVKLVKEAAMVIPEVRQVGWDVCISENGPMIVEGNNWTDYMFWQLPEHNSRKEGLMPYYRKILPNMKF